MAAIFQPLPRSSEQGRSVPRPSPQGGPQSAPPPPRERRAAPPPPPRPQGGQNRAATGGNFSSLVESFRGQGNALNRALDARGLQGEARAQARAQFRAGESTPRPRSSGGGKKKKSSGPAVPKPPSFNDQAREAILKTLGEAGQAPTLQDPGLREANRAFVLQAQRAQERAQRQNAERLNAQGLRGSGAEEVSQEGLQQQFGESTAGNASQLIFGEMQRRRQELQNMLQLAGQLGDNDLSRKLQKKIAKMDMDIRKQSLSLQRELGLGDLNLRRELGLGNLGVSQGRLGLARDQFGHQSSLQNDIFNRGFL